MKRGSKVKKIYALLGEYFGNLKWWPADTDFEVIVGTILTQNTAWTNVEKAIVALKKEKLLNPGKIISTDIRLLARCIRPAGYYRVKARRLKDISRFVVSECNGRLSKLKTVDAEVLRKRLLSVKGVGPETADSILIYALGKPVFVVDAYTRRIFSRHGLISENASYDEVQDLVESHFPADTGMLNQLHALLVETAKNFCKKKTPLCKACPLNGV